MDIQRAKSISIVGTGDFGRSLAKRFILAGYTVTFGSRNPNSRCLSTCDSILADAEVRSIGDCIMQNDIIFLAIRVTDFESFTSTNMEKLSSKILVDVSNQSSKHTVETSNAEELQLMAPGSVVVKALNVISTYAMDSDFESTPKIVPVCSDNCQAKMKVIDIVRSIGFEPRDCGMLSGARESEAFARQLFPKWRFPLLLALLVFSGWWIYVVFLYYIRKTSFSWEQLFIKVLNKPLCMSTITILALTYLPGCLAGYLQLYNGTKHKRFPGWLDFWMRSRKQLGLTAFLLGSLHAFISAMTLSSTYNSSWFHFQEVRIQANASSGVTMILPVRSWMTWKGELSCLTGILAITTMGILAVTSVPSVGETLNWVEWRFVQSKLGLLTLVFAVSHAWIMGFPHWVKNNSFFYMFQSVTFMSSLLPSVVIALRLILALPPVSSRLRRIRHGWESDNALKNSERQKSQGETNTGYFDKKTKHNGHFHNGKSGLRENGIPLSEVIKLPGDIAKYEIHNEVISVQSESDNERDIVEKL